MASPSDRESNDEAEATLKTVTLSEREVKAAAHLLNLLVGEDDRGNALTKMSLADVQTTGNETRDVLVERARLTFVNRSRRSQNFKSAMFGEAAWDMLLAVYVTEQSRTRHTVSGLVNLSGVPPTTALRWLDFLEKDELVTRHANPNDRRVCLIKLTDKARNALNAYFSGTAREGM